MLRTDLPTLADVRAAAGRLRPHARRTPLLEAVIGGRTVVLKLEHLQRAGSFKLRGALAALRSGPLPGHVVTASGGNHGAAVAGAAALLGVPATVVVPVGVPAGKARRIEAAGARLVRHGERYADAAAAAVEVARAHGHRYLPAYDDPDVVAGQGTLAAEVVADDPDVDAFAVGVGGGGLVAGTALAAEGRPVVAVEPAGSCCLAAALDAGHPVDAPVDSVAADALGATRVGAVPFAVLAGRPVISALVSDAEILAARDLLWEECRVAAEPAAAAAFAAWLAGRVPGRRPCVVISGSNTDWAPAPTR